MFDVGFSLLDISDDCDSSPDTSIEVTSDEPTVTNPNAIFTPDATVSGDGKVFLRAESSMPGDGRVYEITATATDASGNSASSSVSVSVNQKAIDSGQNYIATEINW